MCVSVYNVSKSWGSDKSPIAMLINKVDEVSRLYVSTMSENKGDAIVQEC